MAHECGVQEGDLDATMGSWLRLEDSKLLGLLPCTGLLRRFADRPIRPVSVARASLMSQVIKLFDGCPDSKLDQGIRLGVFQLYILSGP